MDLTTRLVSLEKTSEVPKVSAKDLKDPAGHQITGARRVNSKYAASAILLEVKVGEEPAVTFLPNRFAMTLTDDDLKELSSQTYRITCTGVTNNSPDLKIWKV